MSTISGAINYQNMPSLEEAQTEALAKVNAQLALQGKGALDDQSLIQLTPITNQDGTVSIQYKYTLPPPDPGSSEKTGETLDQLNKLNDDGGVVDLFEVMALFHKIAQQQRQAARTDRQTALTAQLTELSNQVQDLKDSAGWALAGAIIQGVTQIASGALTLYGTASSMKGLKPTGDGTDGTSVLTSDKQVDLGLSKWKGWSEIAGGVGNTTKGVMDYESSMEQASAKQHEAGATKFGAERDQANEVAQNMMQVLQDVRQKLSEIIQAQQQVVSSILRA